MTASVKVTFENGYTIAVYKDITGKGQTVLNKIDRKVEKQFAGTDWTGWELLDLKD